MIKVRIIADSVNPCDDRLVSYELTYPWFIHWDFLTHRQISRNALSSRAWPISKVMRQVLAEPAMPNYWGANCKGMQAKKELSKSRRKLATGLWKISSLFNVGVVWLMSKLGVHKQDANKLLTPYMHITTIATATQWGNFFNLRAHADAHPTFQELAFKMLEAYQAGTPKQLKEGEWHLPFCDTDVTAMTNLTLEQKLKVCTARCARVSYLNHFGAIDYEKDFDLHDQLLKSGHMSPFEHAAQAMNWSLPSGNFIGFKQYRKLLPNECRTAFDPVRLLEAKNAA